MHDCYGADFQYVFQPLLRTIAERGIWKKINPAPTKSPQAKTLPNMDNHNRLCINSGIIAISNVGNTPKTMYGVTKTNKKRLRDISPS
jgi:hypothetical protein